MFILCDVDPNVHRYSDKKNNCTTKAIPLDFLI